MGGAVVAILLIAGLIEISYGAELYQLEFLLKSSDPNGFGIKRTAAKTDEAGNKMLPSIIRTCDKLCAYGMWAMYTKPNYGIGAETTTVAYPVQGAKESDCSTSSVNNILRGVYSIRSLGGLSPNMSSYSFYPTAYFIGKNLTLTAGANGIIYKADTTMPELRSLAIAIGTEQNSPKSYTICPKAPGMCFCFDESKASKFLMIADTKTFTSDGVPFNDSVCGIASSTSMPCSPYGLGPRPSPDPCMTT